MQTIALLKQTYSKWSEHKAPRLGASVAFYSILSFAPLLVIITTVIALVIGHEQAQGALVNEARQLMGDRGAETAQTLLKNAQKPSAGIFAGIVAFVTLLFGASGVFTELQDALNTMWEVQAKDADSLMGMVKQRLFSFGMVLSVGFLLLVSLVLSAALAFVGHAFGQILPIPELVMHAINFAVSFIVVTGLFALMFRYLPAIKVAWHEVIVGAVGTALLFSIGKLLLGLYLGKASVGSTYGAAGSLVAVVVWIYYSAQIFFFGAEFTHVYGVEKDPRHREESMAAAAKPEAGSRRGAGLQAKAAVEQSAPALSASASSTAQAKAEPVKMAAVAAASAGSVQPSAAPARIDEPSVNVPTVPVQNAQPPVQAVLPSAERPIVVRRAPDVANAAARKPLEKTKPKLLMSLAVGIAIGRLSRHSAAEEQAAERIRP